MPKTIISEGKTTNEAIEKGLKELKTTKNNVDIKVLEQEKRSFFDILAPRVVKVELTMKDETIVNENNDAHKEFHEKPHIKVEISDEELYRIKGNINSFLNEFLSKIDDTHTYTVDVEDSNILVNIDGMESGVLIGYRGETLNAMQTLLTSIANKNNDNRVKVYLNIDNYKVKREKALEELAVKISKTVLKNNKPITLEPMNAYERKIIHSKLQDNKNIRTHSIGEEPNRRIVIEKVNN
ncbi:MAG: Jag N-terminal domain-containing protein [Clostridia bacterium]|nr:Jag N-terminal domain-containing protein [Clostridia bacterium]